MQGYFASSERIVRAGKVGRAVLWGINWIESHLHLFALLERIIEGKKGAEKERKQKTYHNLSTEGFKGTF